MLQSHWSSRGWQANAFFTAAKTWLGVTGTPEGFLEKTLPEWFGYFQAVVNKNDDGDARSEEWLYGKVRYQMGMSMPCC